MIFIYGISRRGYRNVVKVGALSCTNHANLLILNRGAFYLVGVLEFLAVVDGGEKGVGLGGVDELFWVDAHLDGGGSRSEEHLTEPGGVHLVGIEAVDGLGGATHHHAVAHVVRFLAGAEGVGVVIKAKHLCMMMRGVEKQNSEMTTSAVLGTFRSDEKVRGEFLSLIK